jgi:hypothetical protein
MSLRSPESKEGARSRQQAAGQAPSLFLTRFAVYSKKRLTYFSLKRWLFSNGIYGVIFQEVALFITNAKKVQMLCYEKILAEKNKIGAGL